MMSRRVRKTPDSLQPIQSSNPKTAIAFQLAAGFSPDSIQGSSDRPVDDIVDAIPMPRDGVYTRPGSELHFSTAFAHTTPAGRVAIGLTAPPNVTNGTQMFFGVDTSRGGAGVVMLDTMKPGNFGAGAGIFPAFALNDESVAVAPGNPAALIVRRLGYAACAASVRAQTADDSAVAGVDYVAFDEVLSFASGEVAEDIEIETIDDGQAGVKRFFVVLSNPTTGARLDYPIQAEVQMLGSY